MPIMCSRYEAISSENFSQSEYVAVGAFFQISFPPLARDDPSCVPLCKSFEHVCQTSVLLHNLSNDGFFIASQSVRINISFR